MSKVAFSPGRILHTNEFQVQDERSGERKWMSHVETADHLRAKLHTLRTQRSHLMQQLSAADSVPPQLTASLPLENDIDDESYDDVEVEEEITSNAVANNTEESEDIMGSDPFEIREFCDDEGNEVRSEVVSLAKAFDSATQKVPRDNEKLNKIYEDIAAKLNVNSPAPVEVDVILNSNIIRAN